jgi:hypothetical protein
MRSLHSILAIAYVAMLSCCFLEACSASGQSVPRAQATPTDEPLVAQSNDDNFIVVIKPFTKTPALRRFSMNQTFAVEAYVVSTRNDESRADVTLSVDALMPEHNHGMNTRAIVTPDGVGKFRVDGLMLHMRGEWELYFDIARGNRVERAQFSVVAE